MPIDANFLNYSAVLLYAATLLACALATRAVRSHGLHDWQGRVWLGLIVLFAALIVSRLLNVEDILRDALRSALRDGGAYGGRRDVQSWIAGSIIMVAACATGFWLFRMTRRMRGRRASASIVALFAGVGMAFLVVMRLISLHVIDRLLYGPLKLNWIGDIGLTLAVMGAALYFTRIAQQRSA